MPLRPLLVAALVVGSSLAVGCGPGADRPPGTADQPPPPAPDGTDTGAGGEELEPGTVAIPEGDEALPPAPVPVRGVVGSCDVRSTEPMCYAFTGAGWTVAAAQTECGGAEGGVFQTASCPTADRIGECVYRPGGDVAREIVYTFYAPMDPLVAEGVCRGTFRAF